MAKGWGAGSPPRSRPKFESGSIQRTILLTLAAYVVQKARKTVCSEFKLVEVLQCPTIVLTVKPVFDLVEETCGSRIVSWLQIHVIHSSVVDACGPQIFRWS